jgi:5-deoxy-D-glucuronate isomerase
MALNDTQLEILKLFRGNQSEEELQEIKSLLIAYLAGKVTMEADKAFDKQGYSTAVFEKWKQEHFRKTN